MTSKKNVTTRLSMREWQARNAKKRLQKLTPKRRSEIAKLAAEARWKKEKSA